MAIKQTLPTDAQVVKFQMLNEFSESIYKEMKELSKKKPDQILFQYLPQ